MNIKEEYSIIIPAYNEEDVIGKVLEDLKDLPMCTDVIVINDGSSDRTGEIVSKTYATLINHPFNKGYGAGLKSGIKACKTKYFLIYDGDGQHRKEDLLRVAEIMHEYDMVVGARDSKSHQLAVRKPLKKILNWFVNLLSEREIPDINSGLRSFDVDVIKKYVHLMPQGFSFSTTSTVALNKMGYNVKYIPIVVNAREGRKSSVKIFRDGFKTLMLIINLTVMFDPMKVFLPISLFMLMSSLIYFVTYSIMFRIHITPSMTMLFITGVITFLMGILCEQISATRRELNNTK